MNAVEPTLIEKLKRLEIVEPMALQGVVPDPDDDFVVITPVRHRALLRNLRKRHQDLDRLERNRHGSLLSSLDHPQLL
jgi:hypothetical protein